MEPGPSSDAESSYQNSPTHRYSCPNENHRNCALNTNPVIFHEECATTTRDREHYFRVFFLCFFVIECLRLSLATWMVLEQNCNCPRFLSAGLWGLGQSAISVLLIGYSLSDYGYRWLSLVFFILVAVAEPFLSDMSQVGSIFEEINGYFSDPKNKVMYMLGYAIYTLLFSRWLYFLSVVFSVTLYFCFLFMRNRRSYEDLQEEE